ncbi:hypothetical protein T439DRAFT_365635 [Meredithblackwellia eburnea MCA 4105]
MVAAKLVPTLSIIKAPLKPLIEIETVLGEGPVWEPETGTLHFVDVGSNCVHHYHYATGKLTTDWYDCMIGSIALRKNHPGFVAAAQHGFAFLPERSPHSTKERPDKINFILNPIDLNLQSKRMFNDGACDASGRFFAGTKTVRGIPMDDHLKLGKAYRFEGDGKGGFKAEKIMDHLTVPNGIGFSSDCRTMYVTDTRAMRIVSFDYDDETATMSNERDFCKTLYLGRPDGLCLDDQDRVYSAKWAGPRVTRYLPDGTIDLEIVFDTAYNITAPVFGGPNMDILFVTTGSLKESLEDQDPKLSQYRADSGKVFAVHLPGVRGVEKRRFGW